MWVLTENNGAVNLDVFGHLKTWEYAGHYYITASNGVKDIDLGVYQSREKAVKEVENLIRALETDYIKVYTQPLKN